MKILPKFVKAGDPVTASDYNKLTRSVRDSKFINPYGDSILAGISNKVNQPFDIIDYSVKTDGRHVIKLKTGYIFQGTDSFQIYTPNTLDGYYAPLEIIPEIVIPQQLINADVAWMYVDLEKFELNFHGADEYDSRAIYVGKFKFEVSPPDSNGDTNLTQFEYINLHPSNIVKNTNNYFIATVWNSDTAVLKSTAPTACTLTISNGYVINNEPQSTSTKVLNIHKVKSGLPAPSDYLDSPFSPVYAGIEPDQSIYVRVQTNFKGVVSEEPEIVIGGEDEESVHYQPAPIETDGDYQYKIATIKLLEFAGSGSGKYYQFVVDQVWDQNIFVQSDLISIKNVGEKREIYKTIDTENAEYQLRSLEQLEGGEGEEVVPIIKPLEDGEEQEDLDTIPFRFLTERATQPQIKVKETTDKKGIKIEGNDYDFEATSGVVGITVKDGLVTDVDVETSAQNLNLKINGFSITTEAPYIQTNSSISYLYWRNGLFVGTGSESPPVTNGLPLIEKEVADIAPLEF